MTKVKGLYWMMLGCAGPKMCVLDFWPSKLAIKFCFPHEGTTKMNKKGCFSVAMGILN